MAEQSGLQRRERSDPIHPRIPPGNQRPGEARSPVLIGDAEGGEAESSAQRLSGRHELPGPRGVSGTGHLRFGWDRNGRLVTVRLRGGRPVPREAHAGDVSKAHRAVQELRQTPRQHGVRLLHVPRRRGARGRGWDIVDWSMMPPRLKGDYVYDQTAQAREVADLLRVNDEGGVDATFVFTFVEPGAVLEDSVDHQMVRALKFDLDIV